MPKSSGLIRPKVFWSAGAETGAHLAAICAIRARNKDPSIEINEQNLIIPIPSISQSEETPAEWTSRLRSYKDNSEAPLLDTKFMAMMAEALNVPKEERYRGENFPLFAALEGLPPA